MHGKKQIAVQKKRMQDNLHRKRTQQNLDKELFKLCCKETASLNKDELSHLISTAKMLIDHGANLEIRTKFNSTPLHIACFCNNIFMVKSLIASGANINASGANVPHRKKELDDYAAQHTASILENFTPLHIATMLGNFDMVNMLIMAQADTNFQRADGSTPLHSACCEPNIKIAKILLQNNARPNIQASYGTTPLYCATTSNSIEIIQLLFEFQADPNIPDLYGETPLHVACDIGNVEIVKALLNKQANVNAATKQKYTPLHVAVFYDHPEIVKLLLKNNANVHAQSNVVDRATPMLLAYRKKNPIIIDLLIKYGAQDISDKQAQMDEQKFFNDINQKESEAIIIPEKENSILPETKTASSCKKQATQPNNLKIDAPHNHPPILLKKNEYQILQDKKFEWGKFLSSTQQNNIKNHLKQLKFWPDTHDLDVKILQGAKQRTYRLRVGNCRILFSVDEKHRQIFIQEIGLRKTIYKRTKLI
jgi:ankyrin repeat protein/mRNA-degrading endonuclease RelE of RelBE toxin-antitoxin system